MLIAFMLTPVLFVQIFKIWPPEGLLIINHAGHFFLNPLPSRDEGSQGSRKQMGGTLWEEPIFFLMPGSSHLTLSGHSGKNKTIDKYFLHSYDNSKTNRKGFTPMARPKKKDKLVPFTVMLPPENIEELKRIAEKGEIPAGRLARNCLQLGLEEAKGMERLGLVQLVGSSRRTIEQFKKRFNIKSDFRDIDELEE